MGQSSGEAAREVVEYPNVFLVDVEALKWVNKKVIDVV
jgi:hypothetical protein